MPHITSSVDLGDAFEEMKARHFAGFLQSAPAHHIKISVHFAIEMLQEYDNRIVKYMQDSSDKDGAFITPETAKGVWEKTHWHLEIKLLIEELKKLL